MSAGGATTGTATSTSSGNPRAWPGTWFDGGSAHPHAVTLHVADGRLILRPQAQGLDPKRSYALRKLRWPEAWKGSPRGFALPDGSALWVRDDAERGFLAALKSEGLRPGFAARVAASSAGVVLCVLLLIALVAWLDRVGIAAATKAAVAWMPPRVEQHLGRDLLAFLDSGELLPSKLPEARRERLRQRYLAAAAKAAPGVVTRLEFRGWRAGDMPNAFALPGGWVVLLDDLADRLGDDEVLGVLGHELGHVAHRHGLEVVLSGGATFILGAVVLGDFSMVLAGSGSVLRMLAYGREKEHQADVFALRFVDAAGVPRGALVSTFSKLAQLDAALPAPPEWFANHPDTAARLRFFAAAAAQRPAP